MASRVWPRRFPRQRPSRLGSCFICTLYYQDEPRTKKNQEERSAVSEGNPAKHYYILLPTTGLFVTRLILFFASLICLPLHQNALSSMPLPAPPERARPTREGEASCSWSRCLVAGDWSIITVWTVSGLWCFVSLSDCVSSISCRSDPVFLQPSSMGLD